MIKFILNGYYRTGSTAMWEVIKKSNKNYLVLYEPFHPHILNAPLSTSKFNLLTKVIEEGNVNKLHNKKDIFKDYFELKLKDIVKLHIVHKDWTTVTEYCEIKDFLRILNCLDLPIILQTNRIHFFLNDVADEFKCNYVHIIRNPISNIISLKSKGFYYKEMFKVYKKKGLLLTSQCKYALDPEKKMLAVWATVNNAAYQQVKKSKKGIIIKYEDIVHHKNIKYIEKKGRISLKEYRLLNSNSLKKYTEEDKKRIIRKIEQLKLKKFIELFYKLNEIL